MINYRSCQKHNDLRNESFLKPQTKKFKKLEKKCLTNETTYDKLNELFRKKQKTTLIIKQ